MHQIPQTVIDKLQLKHLPMLENGDFQTPKSNFPDNALIFQARPLLNHALDNQDFENLVDPRLGRNYDESEMLRMIGIAAACVRHASAKRPQMGQVVFLLLICNTNTYNRN